MHRGSGAINQPAGQSDVPYAAKMKCKYKCVALRLRPVYNCPRSQFEVNEIRFIAERLGDAHVYSGPFMQSNANKYATM